MPNDYRMSLPYPNPSLGQMAILDERREDEPPQTQTISGIRKHHVSGPRQVVLVISYVIELDMSTHLLTLIAYLRGSFSQV